MRAKLIFNLPEEQTDFNRATQSLDMACALFDILQLRKKIEREFENIDNTNNDVFDVIERMAEGIAYILEEHNINLDKLIE